MLQLIPTAKAKLLFTWDTITRRFRNDRGQFVSTGRIEEAREAMLERAREVNTELAQRLIDRQITIQQWESEMRRNLRALYTVQYMVGRGGRGQMSQRDWGILGSELKKQYGYLGKFAREIALGRYTVEQAGAIVTRMNLYANSSNQAFQRGQGEAYAGVTLPHYPGDGSSECMSNDRCSLRWQQVAGGWDVYWELAAAEHCPTCKRRAGNSPLRVRGGKVENGSVWN